MADCYPPEADDLHRRWLPREIFADIGIADPEPLADAAPSAAATAEELAAQLAGMLGSGGKDKPAQKRAPPPPPPPPVARAPVCGLEGTVVMAYGGAAVAWPVTPYSPVQWQVASNYSMLPPPPRCLVPGAAAATKLRGGTGVFLPRTDAYRHAPPPAKDVKAPSPRTWAGAARPVQKQNEGEAQNRQKASAAEVALALPQDWSYH